MIGKVINYGTDTLLPEKFKSTGDYACAAIDCATGDYLSAGLLLTEGISENLKTQKNQDAALLADVSKTALSAASGDLKKAFQEDRVDSLKNAMLKMGAVYTSAGIGKTIDDSNGAKVGTLIATNSIRDNIQETALKSGANIVGATAGYKLKGKDGVIEGINIGNSVTNLGFETTKISNKEKIDIEDIRDIKSETISVVKNTKALIEDKPGSKSEAREKLTGDRIIEMVDNTTDTAITSIQLAESEDPNNIDKEEKVFKLLSELGQTGSAICKIREKKIESEGKVYKTTDTVCYFMENWKNIKNASEINKKNKENAQN